jgi:hypothetical protein
MLQFYEKNVKIVKAVPDAAQDIADDVAGE